MPRDASNAKRKGRASNHKTKLMCSSAKGTAVHAWAQLHLATIPKNLGSWDVTRTSAYLALRELLREEMSQTVRHPRMDFLSTLRLRIERIHSAPLAEIHLMLHVKAHTLKRADLLLANPSIKDPAIQATAKKLSFSSALVNKTASLLP